jgi:hypothetical protein
MRSVVLMVLTALVAATITWIAGLFLDSASSELGAAILVAWGLVLTIWGLSGLFGSQR